MRQCTMQITAEALSVLRFVLNLRQTASALIHTAALSSLESGAESARACGSLVVRAINASDSELNHKERA